MTERDFAGDDTSAIKSRLIRAAKTWDGSSDELRSTVCALVDKMRAEGAPPETVIIEVKALITEATATKRLTRDAESAEARERYLSQAVTWCIERYFERSAS